MKNNPDNSQTHTTISTIPPTIHPSPPPPNIIPASFPQAVISEGKLDCREARSDYECRRLARLSAERDLAEKSHKVVISVGGMITQDGQLKILDNDGIAGYSRAVLQNVQNLFEGKKDGYYVVRLRADVVSF